VYIFDPPSIFLNSSFKSKEKQEINLPSVFSLAISGGFFGLPITLLCPFLFNFEEPPPEGLDLDFDRDLDDPLIP